MRQLLILLIAEEDQLRPLPGYSFGDDLSYRIPESHEAYLNNRYVDLFIKAAEPYKSGWIYNSYRYRNRNTGEYAHYDRFRTRIRPYRSGYLQYVTFLISMPLFYYCYPDLSVQFIFDGMYIYVKLIM